MRIGGLQRFSLIDYPGHVAAVVFTQGCNFRCPYCHNPELVVPERYESCIADDIIFNHLDQRRDQLGGVVVTGGEPTIHHDLPTFIMKIKEKGYPVKLDTNGTHPDMLGWLIREGLIDYVAMDIKNSLSRYCLATGVQVDMGRINRSIDIILSSGIEYMFRTTVDESIVHHDDLSAIVERIGKDAHYRMQACRISERNLKPSFR